MRVFIYACESIYGGLHGMYNQVVTDVYDLNEADNLGREMAWEVIDSYDCFDDYSEEELRESLEWYVSPIKAEITLSDEELDEIAYDIGYEEFEEKYCERE